MNSDIIEVKSGYGDRWRFKVVWVDASTLMFRVWIDNEDRGLHKSWYEYLVSEGVL